MAEASEYVEFERKIMQPAAAEPVPREEKTISAEAFVTSWALHSPVRVPNFSPPSKISFQCPGACSKETTWHQDGETQPINDNMARRTMYSVSYSCTLCGRSNLVVMWRNLTTEPMTTISPPVYGKGSTTPPSQVQVTSKIVKVGQYPPLSITVSKPLAKGLGEDALSLYRKALISRNNGYGLAAAVYMRRVVEDKTNELIEVAAQLAESHNVDAETVAKIRASASLEVYTPYEDKLKVAATVFPEQLKAGSVNPLKTLYGLVSKAIHGLSESDCLDVADQTKDVFEYVFTNLRAQVADQKAFLEKMKTFA